MYQIFRFPMKSMLVLPKSRMKRCSSEISQDIRVSRETVSRN